MLSSNRSSFKILLVIVFFVYVDIVCENVLVIVNDQLNHLKATIFLLCFSLLQVFFASLQSGLSDFFGRRKSLIVSFLFSISSLLLLLIYNQFCSATILLLGAALLAKSVWGNTIPMAFAAIVDTQKKDHRGAFAIASSTYSLGFITLIFLNMISKSNLFHICFALVIIILALRITVTLFQDTSDQTAHLPHYASIEETHSWVITFWKISVRELRLIYKELKRPLTLVALLAYLMWEISMYSIIISQIDFNPGPAQRITFAMMVGYLVGVFILKLRPIIRVKDINMITTGYLISFSSLIPYFFLYKYFTTYSLILLGGCYALHAVGNAFLSPSILSIITKNRPIHDQGKILGLVESTDTIAFLIATVAVMLYAEYQLPVIVLVIFSFISFSFSWAYYPLIRRHNKTIYNDHHMS